MTSLIPRLVLPLTKQKYNKEKEAGVAYYYPISPLALLSVRKAGATAKSIISAFTENVRRKRKKIFSCIFNRGLTFSYRRVINRRL
jgi:hypothetical protein